MSDDLAQAASATAQPGVLRSWQQLLTRCGWIVAFGVALRLLVLAFRFDQLSVDTDAYLAIARCLIQGDGYCSVPGHPTAFRPPLYPWLVALCLSTVGPLGIGLLHVACGGLTVWLTFQLARRLGLVDAVAGFAALAVAVDPLLLNYTSQAMTEVLMAGLVTAYLWSIADPRRSTSNGVVAGTLFGLSALCRPTMWAYGLLMLVSLAAEWLRRGLRTSSWVVGRTAGQWFLVFAVTLAAVMAPWILRNSLVFGQPIVTTTHGGYTLVLGNNAAYFSDVVSQPFGQVWSLDKLTKWQVELEQELDRRGIARTDEVGRDRAQRDIGLEWIRSHPAHFLRSAVHRERLLWSLVPQVDSGLSRPVVLLIGTWYAVLFLAALLGMCACRNGSIAWGSLLILIISLTMLHSVYWANARMRAPVGPALAVFAAVGAQKAGSRLKFGRRPYAVD